MTASFLSWGPAETGVDKLLVHGHLDVQQPLEDEVAGRAGHLIERLPADRAGRVHPQVGRDAGL